MLALAPIPGIYDSQVAYFLSHAGETFRNVVRIYHHYDHTPYPDIALTGCGKTPRRACFGKGLGRFNPMAIGTPSLHPVGGRLGRFSIQGLFELRLSPEIGGAQDGN